MKKALLIVFVGGLIAFFCRNKILLTPSGSLIEYNRFTGSAEWVEIKSPTAQYRPPDLAELPAAELRSLVVNAETGGNADNISFIDGSVYNPTSHTIVGAIVKVSQVVVNTGQPFDKLTPREYRVNCTIEPLSEGKFQANVRIPTNAGLRTVVEMVKAYYLK